jgi:2-methylcitrate dehydratase
VQRDAELSALYPQAVGNIVTVTRRDGSMLRERVDYPRGHARNPMSDGEVEAKFRTLAESVLGVARAEQVCRWVWRLEEAATADGLLELLRMR